jgi:hypothetical protein
MSPERIVLCLAGFIAVIMLVRLMLRRQQQLVELLRANSESKLEWSRKKARAALIARRAALQTKAGDGASRDSEIEVTME